MPFKESETKLFYDVYPQELSFVGVKHTSSHYVILFVSLYNEDKKNVSIDHW